MKTFFYPRLAWDGLRKNRRLSVPYLLTCISMVSMFYILGFLVSPDVLAMIPRGRTSVAAILSFGRYVILLFSLIFLYYTYSFLLRRRAREFGLYNVLGMGRWNLVRIISWESLITFAVALTGGLFLGILLSKLAELGLVNLLGGTIDYRLRVDAGAIGQSCLFYALIFALIWLSAVIRTSRSSAVSLMKSESAGEKPPKGNWIIALLGIALLGAAYWMAVTIDNPISAMMWFFAAVLMVIIATYLLMVSGSVKMCRILQSSKGYYYKARHFVSVSSMAYRMKRNGAGLASICIIATMILVMISTTTCMWFGIDDSLSASYPREINFTLYLNGPDFLADDVLDRGAAVMQDFLKEKGISPKEILDRRYVSLGGVQQDGIIQCDYSTSGMDENLNSLREIFLVAPESPEVSGIVPPDLAADEAMVITSGMDIREDTLTLAMGSVTRSWKIRQCTRDDSGARSSMGFPAMTVVISDLPGLVDSFSRESEERGGQRLQCMWKYSFDTGLSDEENIQLDESMHDELLSRIHDAFPEEAINIRLIETRAGGAADFYGMYGSLFFIGILLSIVFLFAAVLIIYYKQISEGYEDAKRFDIMQKVGMTKKEIRSSISSQLLTVFALPLAFAGLHLVFAFPMIRKMLTIFGLFNVGLFIRTTLISFAAFALFYGIVYRLTSGIYYRIVSGADSQAA